MKKFIAILLACLIILPAACAESIDLSSLSFDELQELKSRISQEMTTRPEWKETTVPAGLYEIGTDIPAGEWGLKCGKTKYGFVNISYGKQLNDSGTKVDIPCDFMGMIYEEKDEAHQDFINMRLQEGFFIYFEHGSVIFTKPEKPDLGF